MPEEPRNNSESGYQDNNNTRGDGGPVAKVTPSRKTYSSVASDVTVESALGELVDNSLDSASLHRKDSAKIEIEVVEDEDGDIVEFVYRDWCGGVPENQMGVFLGLGRSKAQRASGQNVGTFGMGAKKALKRLGSEFTIASRYEDADQGWKYEVPAEWFEVDEEDDNPNQWEFPLEDAELEDDGMTELRVRSLDITWSEKRREEIVEWFEKTYQKFLGADTGIDIDLDLTVDDVDVEAPNKVEWSYSPWMDGVHPRQFVGLEFTDYDWSDPIQARVTVGLLRNGDKDRCGTYIFCQNRLVESNLTDKKGGFGISGGLPQFRSSQIKRLRIEIELFGDASDLPWNSDKSRIRTSHKALSTVDHGVFYWLKRMADRHMKIGRFGEYPHTSAVFEPYGPNNPFRSINNQYEVVDLSDKQSRLSRGKISHPRVSQKPDKNYTEIRRIARLARASARLGVVLDDVSTAKFDGWAQPTYEHMVGEEFLNIYWDARTKEFETDYASELGAFGDFSELARKINSDHHSETPDEITAALTTISHLSPIENWDIAEGDDDLPDDVDAHVGHIEQLVRNDLEVDQRRTGLEPWNQPIYDAIWTSMADNYDVVVEEADTVDEGLPADTAGEKETKTESSSQSDRGSADETNSSETAESEPDVTQNGKSGVEGKSDESTQEDRSEQDESPEMEPPWSTSGEVGDTEETTTDEDPESATKEMTLREFAQRHKELFDGEIPDDDEMLEETMVQRLEKYQQFIKISSSQ